MTTASTDSESSCELKAQKVCHSPKVLACQDLGDSMDNGLEKVCFYTALQAISDRREEERTNPIQAVLHPDLSPY